MKRFVASLTIMSLCWGHALAQQPASTLQTIAGWRGVEGKRITVLKTSSTRMAGRVVKADTTRYAYDFTIIAVHDTGYVVRWRMHSYHSTAKRADAADELRDNPLLREFYIDVGTDPYGGYARIINLDRLRSQINLVIESLKQQAAQDTSARGRQVLQTLELMQREGMFERLLLGSMVADAQLYLLNYGRVFRIGIAEQDSVAMENQLGGSPIPARRTSQVTPPKNRKGDHRISLISETDSVQTAQILTQTMRQLAQKSYGATDSSKHYPPMRLVVQHDFYYHAPSGWMRKVHWEKRVYSKAVVRTEATTIQLEGNLRER